MAIDYEALGRYTAAWEGAIRLIEARNSAKNNLERMLKYHGLGSNSESFEPLDVTKIKGMADALSDLEEETRFAVEEANRLADIAGKRKILVRDR